MKAAQINEYGNPSVVRVNNIEPPKASEGQVLIEVHASSLNPFDTMVREGYVSNMIKSLPITLGGDIAGIIKGVGKGVSDFSVGDEVYGQANVVAGNSGAFAEFAATKASQIAKKPKNLDFNESASLVLVGVSALQALTTHLDLQAGQKVFIHGAGGIGVVAIQIAKHLGAHVATTATGEALELASSLGADEVIDYKTTDYTKMLNEYDAVFDTVGDDFSKTFLVLKNGGKAVSMIAAVDEAEAKEHQVIAFTQSTHVTTENLDALRQLIEDGAVKPDVGRVFQLTQIQDAFNTRESGDVRGKIVVHISSN